jgi:hypothetical protein
MVNIEIGRQAIASVYLSLGTPLNWATPGRTWGLKVFLGSVFSATPVQKPQLRLVGGVFLDCLLTMRR